MERRIWAEHKSSQASTSVTFFSSRNIILIWIYFYFIFRDAKSLLDPYKSALDDIEIQINDQSEKISAVKRKIIINEEKISKLLFNIGKRN